MTWRLWLTRYASALLWIGLFASAIPVVFATEGLLGDDPIGAVSGFAVALLMYSFLPALLAVPVALPGAILWRTPLRIVLLRPFAHPASSRALKQAANKGLAPYGHTYTLSDARIRSPWYFRIPLLLGPLRQFSFKHGRISSERRIKKLRRSLDQRIRRNLNWFLSPNHIFPLRAKDAFWQESVEVLINGADLIVMDLSGLHDAVRWELSLCSRLGMLENTVLLAKDEDAETVRTWLANEGYSCEYELISYSDGQALAHALTALIKRRHPEATTVASPWPSRLVAAGLALGLAMLVATYAGQLYTYTPQYLPYLTARMSPWSDLVLTVYEDALLNADQRLEDYAYVRLTEDFPQIFSRFVQSRLGPEFDNRIRLAAVREISRSGDRAALQPLLNAIASEPETRQASEFVYAAAQALLENGIEPWAQIKDILKSQQEYKLKGALEIVLGYHYAPFSPLLYPILQHSNSSMVSLAARTLAELGDKDAVPHLYESLRVSAFGRVSREDPVTEALFRLIDDEHVPFFMQKAIHAENLVRREYCLRALVAIRSKQAIEALFSVLEATSKTDVDLDAIAAAASVGDQIALKLSGMITDFVWDTVGKTAIPGASYSPAFALGEVLEAQHLSLLLAKLESKSQGVRIFTIQTLARLGDCSVLAPMAKAVAGQKTHSIGVSAAAELAKRNAGCVLEVLALLEHRDAKVAAVAEELLVLGRGALADDPRVMPALDKMVRRKVPGAAYTLARKISYLGTEDEALVISFLDRRYPKTVNEAAVSWLAEQGSASATTPLLNAFRRELISEFRLAHALARIPVTQLEPLIIGLLTDSKEAVRLFAARWLEEHGTNRARNALENASSDPSPLVRWSCERALSRLSQSENR